MAIAEFPHLSNAEFFYHYTQPGMAGLLGASGPGRLMSTGVRWLAGDALRLKQPASYWSHAFMVLEKERTPKGWHVKIVESTIVNRFQRPNESTKMPRNARSNGPQVSTLFWEDEGGNLLGPSDRKRIRQYIDAEYTPNVALIDLGLNDAQLARFRGIARELLSSRQSVYMKRGILGLLCACLDDKLTIPNPLNRSGLNCTAFVRACLDDIIPAFRDIDADRRNTFPEHLYQAAIKSGYDVYQIIREPNPTGLTGLSSRAILSVMKQAWGVKNKLTALYNATLSIH